MNVNAVELVLIVAGAVALYTVCWAFVINLAYPEDTQEHAEKQEADNG